MVVEAIGRRCHQPNIRDGVLGGGATIQRTCWPYYTMRGDKHRRCRICKKCTTWIYSTYHGWSMCPGHCFVQQHGAMMLWKSMPMNTWRISKNDEAFRISLDFSIGSNIRCICFKYEIIISYSIWGYRFVGSNILSLQWNFHYHSCQLLCAKTHYNLISLHCWIDK